MNTIIKAELALFTVAFLWGINPPIMKLGLEWVPPILYNTIRMAFACTCALVAFRISGQYRPMARGDMWELVKLSCGGFFVFQLFFTLGVQRTTGGNASLLLGMLPIWIAIIHKICGIEEISRRMFAGIMLSFLGILFLVLGSGKEMSLASDHLIGAVFLIIAQVGYAYFTVFSKPLIGSYSHYQTTAFVLVVNTLLFCLISLPDLLSIDWQAVPVYGWISTAYSGIFAIAVGNFLWIWGVSHVGSAKAALYNNIAPAFAIVTGYILLGETFGLLQGLGTAVTFSGLYLTRVRKKE